MMKEKKFMETIDKAINNIISEIEETKNVDYALMLTYRVCGMMNTYSIYFGCYGNKELISDVMEMIGLWTVRINNALSSKQK